MPPIRLVSVVGARPQFVKLAPICRAISARLPESEHRIVHTGQHYDYGMSDVFFEDLDIPPPDLNLNIGSGGHGAQTGAMMSALEEQLPERGPDGVIVFGDTNSTLAASLVAAKLHIPLFHVEAGLRSFDRRMPEEINRIVADHCSELLFAPTEAAMKNLRQEGLGERAVHVGDVMYDAVLQNSTNAEIGLDIPIEQERFGVVTVHRAANTQESVLRELIETFVAIADTQIPLIFPVHPRTRAVLREGRHRGSSRLVIIDPLPHSKMLALIKKASVVLTDSGGLQKEAFCLKTPCVTLRETTEWPETIAANANLLAGTSGPAIIDAVRTLVEREPVDWSALIEHHYGKGDAACKIVDSIARWLGRRSH